MSLRIATQPISPTDSWETGGKTVIVAPRSLRSNDDVLASLVRAVDGPANVVFVTDPRPLALGFGLFHRRLMNRLMSTGARRIVVALDIYGVDPYDKRCTLRQQVAEVEAALITGMHRRGREVMVRTYNTADNLAQRIMPATPKPDTLYRQRLHYVLTHYPWVALYRSHRQA